MSQGLQLASSHLHCLKINVFMGSDLWLWPSKVNDNGVGRSFSHVPGVQAYLSAKDTCCFHLAATLSPAPLPGSSRKHSQCAGRRCYKSNAFFFFFLMFFLLGGSLFAFSIFFLAFLKAWTRSIRAEVTAGLCTCVQKQRSMQFLYSTAVVCTWE